MIHQYFLSKYYYYDALKNMLINKIISGFVNGVKKKSQIKMAFSVSARAALMTGAANGISAAVAEQMLKKGLSSLVAMDLNPKIVEVAEVWQSKYPNTHIIPVVGDVTDAKVR